MKIEQKINSFLNKFPFIKKCIKRIYQLLMYTFSKKIKFEGNIQRMSPNDNYEYFFGYYDKSPWDIKNQYMLCLRTKNTYKNVAPREKADIVIIDTKEPLNSNKRIRIVASTSSWNVQQGCMLQWLGPDFQSKIIYNDFQDDKYCSIILDLKTNKKTIIDMPIYSVSSDGTFALTLDFSRLHTLRPGYGYANKNDETKGIAIPNGSCIWKVDLIKNKIVSIIEYDKIINFEPRKEMNGAIHKVNHIMINPSGTRFMFLHRWFKGSKKYSRLLTCDINGENLYNLSDDDMVSHCYWKNDEEIFAFLNKKNLGNGYYLMKDKTNKFTKCCSTLTGDGHPSFSPNLKYLITDSYPDRKRIQNLYLIDAKNLKKAEPIVVARVFSPFKYDNDTRCDLHPRWNRSSNEVCIDSVFEGKRGLYVVNVEELVNKK